MPPILIGHVLHSAQRIEFRLVLNREQFVFKSEFLPVKENETNFGQMQRQMEAIVYCPRPPHIWQALLLSLV